MARNRREIQTQKEEETAVSKQQGTGLRCPDCGATSHVKSTNAMPDEGLTRRYRQCDSCGIHFYTKEEFERKTVPRNK